jgi:hypothetical protein
MAEEIIEPSIIEAEPSVPKVEGEVSKDIPSVERIEFHETGHERAEAKYKQILSKVVAPKAASASDDAVIDAKSLNDMTDEEGKVQKLLDLAQMKGVEHAVRVARSLGDYYVLDRMHDELAGKLYEGLVEKGLIGKE